MKKSLLILSMFTSCVLSAQTLSESVDYTIDSKIFEAKRTVSVFVPNAYNTDSTTRFHVAYLLDGQSKPIYSLICSTIRYHENMYEGMPLIVVGIHSENRYAEFPPVCEEKRTDKMTGADQLSFFIEKEVMPLINSNYRTSGYNIGIGHSLGGTFLFNEIVKKNPLFQSIIAISPNLLPCNEQIHRNAQRFFQDDPGKRRFVFTTVGTVGEMENSFRQSLLRMDSLVIQQGSNHFDWHCNVIEGERHTSNLVTSFSKGYLELSSKFVISDAEMVRMSEDKSTDIVSHIRNFYARASEIAGVGQAIEIGKLEEFSAVMSYEAKYEEAIEVCRFALSLLEKQKLPEETMKLKVSWFSGILVRSEFNLHVVEADKWATMGKYDEASEAYQRAFAVDLMVLTHETRIAAVPIFAMAGKTEEAFKQLDLLANTFELNGSEQFINDPRCASLKKDKRWKKLMNKLSTNKGVKFEYLF